MNDPQTGLLPCTRVELIDHRTGAEPFGRVFSAWDCRVEVQRQDGGRTLKVFVDGVAPAAAIVPSCPRCGSHQFTSAAPGLVDCVSCGASDLTTNQVRAVAPPGASPGPEAIRAFTDALPSAIRSVWGEVQFAGVVSALMAYNAARGVGVSRPALGDVQVEPPHDGVRDR